MNGSAMPSRNAEHLAVEDAVPRQAAAVATTSGNSPLMSCRSRLNSRTSSPCLCSWARMPSYLSSTQTGEPSRSSTSASSATGEASIDLSGRNSASSALAERAVAGQLRRVARGRR